VAPAFVLLRHAMSWPGRQFAAAACSQAAQAWGLATAFGGGAAVYGQPQDAGHQQSFGIATMLAFSTRRPRACPDDARNTLGVVLADDLLGPPHATGGEVDGQSQKLPTPKGCSS
jgi:hypothetical protein